MPEFRSIDDFTADRFTATAWEGAEAKVRFARDFVSFVESDFAPARFTRSFYRRLSLTFGHIAHYDRLGFYDTFFTTTEDKVRFLRQTLDHPCYGDPALTYSDVERALQGWVRVNGVLARYEGRPAGRNAEAVTGAGCEANPGVQPGQTRPGLETYRLRVDELVRFSKVIEVEARGLDEARELAVEQATESFEPVFDWLDSERVSIEATPIGSPESEAVHGKPADEEHTPARRHER
jgi:hypothetical protein